MKHQLRRSEFLFESADRIQPVFTGNNPNSDRLQSNITRFERLRRLQTFFLRRFIVCCLLFDAMGSSQDGFVVRNRARTKMGTAEETVSLQRNLHQKEMNIIKAI